MRMSNKKQEPRVTIWREGEDYHRFMDIQRIWKEMSDAKGDVGSCVLGAGFRFEKDGIKYWMPEASCWQGSLSWESSKDLIHGYLINAGAGNIEYEEGRMD